jgi:hypothetical protein
VSNKAKIAMKLKFKVAMMMIESCYCVGRVSGYAGKRVGGGLRRGSRLAMCWLGNAFVHERIISGGVGAEGQ